MKKELVDNNSRGDEGLEKKVMDAFAEYKKTAAAVNKKSKMSY